MRWRVYYGMPLVRCAHGIILAHIYIWSIADKKKKIENHCQMCYPKEHFQDPDILSMRIFPLVFEVYEFLIYSIWQQYYRLLNNIIAILELILFATTLLGLLTLLLTVSFICHLEWKFSSFCSLELLAVLLKRLIYLYR